MRKLLLSSLLALACSRSTDSLTVRNTHEKVNLDTQQSTTSSSGSSEVQHVGPSVTTDAIGGFDELRFGDDAVLEPDGGVVAVDGGRPHVLAVRHKDPSTRVQQKGPEDAQKATWATSTTDAGTKLNDESDEEDAEEKETKTGLLSSPLAWLGGGLLVAGLLYGLYRFRKFIPYLNLIP